jgi:hypothetical protein
MIAAVNERVHNLVTTIIIAILFAYVIFPAVRLLSTADAAGTGCNLRLRRRPCVAIGFANEAVDLSRTLAAMLRSVEGQITHPGTSPILTHFPPGVRTFIVRNAARVGIIASTFAGKHRDAGLRHAAWHEAEQIRATFLRIHATKLLCTTRGDDPEAITVEGATA